MGTHWLVGLEFCIQALMLEVLGYFESTGAFGALSSGVRILDAHSHRERPLKLVTGLLCFANLKNDIHRP